MLCPTSSPAAWIKQVSIDKGLPSVLRNGVASVVQIGENGSTPDARFPTWSPADNPRAIAVSEAQWCLQSVLLAARRIHDGDDSRSPGFSSRQIDARQLVVALWQLLKAQELRHAALRAADADQDVCAELSRARQRFEKTLPGIKNIRDALTHFDEWARGASGGPQKKDVRARNELRDVARTYWSFAYTPSEDTISLIPFVIQLAAAVRAARTLVYAIYQAGRAVDLLAIAELRTRTATRSPRPAYLVGRRMT
jgi:hypothetical protein